MSYKMKQGEKLKRLLIIITLSIIALFLIYTQYYYGKINMEALTVHFIICFNIIIQMFLNIINKFVQALFTENNIKIIIISILILYVIKKLELKTILFGITNIEIGDIKVSRDVKILNELNKIEEENIEKFKQSSSISENEEKIKLSKSKIDLINLMIDDTYIMEILRRFLKSNKSSVTIPMNIFKRKTSLDNINKIFDYEISVNSVKIVGIKANVKDLVCEIYANFDKERCNKVE